MPKTKKTGGRTRNVPNKRTSEAVEQARLDIENAAAAGTQTAVTQIKKKLGKDILEEFMMLFAGMAATYQPLPANATPEQLMNRSPDEIKFLKYAELTVTTARALAEYQSPKFRAILVASPMDQAGGPRDVTPAAGDNVHRINDPVATARVYQQMVRRVG